LVFGEFGGPVFGGERGEGARYGFPFCDAEAVSLLELWNCNWGGLKIGDVYPDSVNLVSPPKTTIPKTLAAEPKSQYATVFEEVSGKNPLFGRAFSSAELEMVLLNDFNGIELFGMFVFRAFDPLGSTAAELLNRIAWERFASSVRDTGCEYFMHWWQTKKSLERRGAARRNPRNSEAIEVVVRPGKEKEKVQDGSI
jgi:hypothetical protein